MFYLGMKGQHIYEPEESNLSIGILGMYNACQMIHFNLEKDKIPEGINMQEALKMADAVSCEYDCKSDYILHLFKKKDGLIGWLERKIVGIDSMRSYESASEGSYTTSKAVEDIPGYDKIATIVSKNNQKLKQDKEEEKR